MPTQEQLLEMIKEIKEAVRLLAENPTKENLYRLEILCSEYKKARNFK